MTAGSPWRDALRRASLREGAGAAAAPAAAPVAPDAVSPRLAELMRERQALEGRIQSLGAAPQADARYAVAPLAERRAEFARWSGARDQQREAERPAAAPALPVPGARAPRVADPVPALRATPGEAVPAGQVPTDPAEWMALRDRSAPRARAPGDAGPPLREAGRGLRESLGALRDPERALREPGLAASPRDDDTPRRETSPADPLRRLQERVRRRTDGTLLQRAERTPAVQALRKARNAIPDAWTERVRERVPGLGKADPYVRDTLRKLAVAVGTLDEIGEKSDRLRETAQAVRELQRADEDGDDARRDRALERLKARRAEDARDE